MIYLSNENLTRLRNRSIIEHSPLLVTEPNQEPYITKYFDYENFRNGMIIYDIPKLTYTVDGKTWRDIEIDHL